MKRIFGWLGLERSGEVNKRLKAIETRLMKTEEAVAALEQARKDQQEANTEVRGKFDALNTRIAELEALVTGGEVPQALADKIAEVVIGAKELADVIPNAPAEPA